MPLGNLLRDLKRVGDSFACLLYIRDTVVYIPGYVFEIL
jgi:hypothetical protein